MERPILDLRELRRYKGRRERADTFEIRSASAPHFVPPQSDGTVDRVQNAHLGRCVLFKRSNKPIRARILRRAMLARFIHCFQIELLT